MKIERQGWPKMLLILGRSGTQYVAKGIKLVSSNCGGHLVESYCKESNISDTNRLRYLFSSYLIKTWLSIWRHHLANLHIWKKIYPEQKEIMGSLHYTVTWYKTRHAGWQKNVTASKNKAISTSQAWRFFVIDVPVRSLPSSRADFTPCDSLMQRAHWK